MSRVLQRKNDNATKFALPSAMASRTHVEVRIGSYLPYKNLTDQCLSWLLDASTAVGYLIPSSLHSTPSLQALIEERKALDPDQTFGEELREASVHGEKAQGETEPNDSAENH